MAFTFITKKGLFLNITHWVVYCPSALLIVKSSLHPPEKEFLPQKKTTWNRRYGLWGLLNTGDFQNCIPGLFHIANMTQWGRLKPPPNAP